MTKFSENYLEIIREEVRKRLKELGIENQLPSEGVIRIVEQESMNYWSEVDDAEEVLDKLQNESEGSRNHGWVDEGDIDPSKVDLFTERASDNLPFPGRDLFGKERGGKKFFVAVIDPEQEAMYIQGHRLNVEDGKVVSRHADGSKCRLQCRTCKLDGAMLVKEEACDYFVRCANCGATTVTCKTQYEVIGAWLIGKMEALPDAS